MSGILCVVYIVVLQYDIGMVLHDIILCGIWQCFPTVFIYCTANSPICETLSNINLTHIIKNIYKTMKLFKVIHFKELTFVSVLNTQRSKKSKGESQFSVLPLPLTPSP